MNFFIKSHIDLLYDLIEKRVDFIIIGGYSVIIYGYVRTTNDLDIWLNPDNKNKEKLINVLKKYIKDKDSIDKVNKLDFTHMVAFHFGSPPERIDFLTKVAGLNFNESYSNSMLLNVGEFTVPVLSFNDLIINKMMSSRLKDQADVEELLKIMNLSKKIKKKS